MRFDLKRIRAVLDRLHNPQNNFSAIHIAGTNGKGSVAAMMESALLKHSLRVGLYTSPHLFKINERYRFMGKFISNKDFSRLKQKTKRAQKKPGSRVISLTEFEILTVVAFLWFSEKKVDIAVVETGLGGRLDATNVMGQVILSVITNIDLEHTHWLGTTHEKIASEKAGIIKPFVPIVTGATGVAKKVIAKKAQDTNAPFYAIDVKKEKFPRLDHLLGAHQKENATLAFKALMILSQTHPQLNRKKILVGIRQAQWPGRFERVGSRVILDAAHNPAAIQTLLKTLQSQGIKRFQLVFGALRDKDYPRMAKALAPRVDQCAVVPLASPRTTAPHKIAGLKAWKGKAKAFPSVDEAWKKIQLTKPPRPVVVTGSLYLVGTLRQRLVSKKGASLVKLKYH